MNDMQLEQVEQMKDMMLDTTDAAPAAPAAEPPPPPEPVPEPPATPPVPGVPPPGEPPPTPPIPEAPPTENQIPLEVRPDAPLQAKIENMNELAPDQKDMLIETLLKRIDRLEGKAPEPQQAPAQVAQPATSGEAQVIAQPQAQAPAMPQLISEEDWDAAIGDHNQANDLFNRFAEQILNKVYRDLGQIVHPIVSQHVDIKTTVSRFFETNEDFTEPTKLRLVNIFAGDVAAEHPEFNNQQIFQEVEKKMRGIYPRGVQEAAETPAPPAPKRAAFARPGGAARSATGEGTDKSLAKEISWLVN